MVYALDSLPSSKEEDWKYTNLQKAVPANISKEAEQESCSVMCSSEETQPDSIERKEWFGEDRGHHNPSLYIEMEPDSQMVFVEYFSGDGEYWNNASSKIFLEEGANLTHVCIQDDALGALHTQRSKIVLQEGAKYKNFTLILGAKLSRYDLDAYIVGKGAQAEFFGVNLLKGAQHTDTRLIVHHEKEEAQSYQYYRSVLDDKATGVFQGKILVEEEAQKTNANQLSHALLLSSLASMNSKPELEIYADDVQCSHGAAAGPLDEKSLFYMRTRGFTEERAKKLLVESFIQDVVAKIDYEDIQKEVAEKVQSWLKQSSLEGAE